MKKQKWWLATAALAITLSAGAFAQSPRWDHGRNRDDYVYAQQRQYGHDYRDAYRDRNRDGDRDHDRYAARNDRDRRGHWRHDRDGDRGRDRD
jgi:hypothetical protein